MVALRLPGETKTAIMKMKVDEMLRGLNDRVANFYSDGVFPGTEQMPASKRLPNYAMQTTALGDIALLANPDYVDEYKAGRAPPPQSPFWLNALSVPDTFKEMQSDFMRLLSAKAGTD